MNSASDLPCVICVVSVSFVLSGAIVIFIAIFLSAKGKSCLQAHSFVLVCVCVRVLECCGYGRLRVDWSFGGLSVYYCWFQLFCSVLYRIVVFCSCVFANLKSSISRTSLAYKLYPTCQEKCNELPFFCIVIVYVRHTIYICRFPFAFLLLISKERILYVSKKTPTCQEKYSYIISFFCRFFYN